MLFARFVLVCDRIKRTREKMQVYRDKGFENLTVDELLEYEHLMDVMDGLDSQLATHIRETYA